MPIPAALNKNLQLPVICAPMFIVSNPDLVIAQCRSGVIGSFPALNARPEALLDDWLLRIKRELAASPGAAPFAVNQIIHASNTRLEHDMALCIKHEVPLIITSLSAPTAIVPRVHAYGGQVFHDVISVRHAEKAIEAGVDHVSTYALIVEDGTALARKVRRGEIAAPDDDVLAARYELLDTHRAKLRGAVVIGVDRYLIADALARHAPEVPVRVLDSTETGVMDEVVALAGAMARPGDTVLLSPGCASLDMFDSYSARGEKFAEAVQRYLAG